MPINPSLLGQPRLPKCAGKHKDILLIINTLLILKLRTDYIKRTTVRGEICIVRTNAVEVLRRNKQCLGQRESQIGVDNVDKPEGFFCWKSETGKIAAQRKRVCMLCWVRYP